MASSVKLSLPTWSPNLHSNPVPVSRTISYMTFNPMVGMMFNIIIKSPCKVLLAQTKQGLVLVTWHYLNTKVPLWQPKQDCFVWKAYPHGVEPSMGISGKGTVISWPMVDNSVERLVNVAWIYLKILRGKRLVTMDKTESCNTSYYMVSPNQW